MRHLATASLLACCAALTPLAASAADLELALSSWLPPRHPIVVNAIQPWAEEVEAVTEGRVSVRVLGKPLGSPPAHFDMARDGIADITYGLHSFTQDDRFAGSQLGQFSFLGDDAVASSKAFWSVYTEDLNAREEHAGTHLLGLFMHGPGLIHNNLRKIETPADFAGMKMRVPGGYVADLASDLGATPLFMSSPEVYEKLSRGVIDGVAFTYEALTAFNLTKDIKYSMTVPGGVYNTTWFMVMDEDRWNEISPEDQAAIDAISGLAFAERVGSAWTEADRVATGEIEAAGIEVYPAPEVVEAAIRTSATKSEEAWAASLPEGEDGTAALAKLRDLTGVGASGAAFAMIAGRVELVIEGLAATLLLALMAVTGVDVIGRYLLNAPLSGAFELTELLLGALVFVALPLVSRTGSHVEVDLLVELLPQPVIRGLGLCAALISAAVLIFFAWRLVLLGLGQIADGSQSVSLGVPLAPFALLGAVACVLAAAFGLL